MIRDLLQSPSIIPSKTCHTLLASDHDGHTFLEKKVYKKSRLGGARQQCSIFHSHRSIVISKYDIFRDSERLNGLELKFVAISIPIYAYPLISSQMSGCDSSNGN